MRTKTMDSSFAWFGRIASLFLLAGILTSSSISLAAEEKPDPNKITSSKVVSCAKWGAFFVAGCSGVAGLVFDELIDKYVGIQPLRLAAAVSTALWGGATYLEYRAQCNKDALCVKHARDIQTEQQHLTEQLAETEGTLAETIASLELVNQQLAGKKEELQQTRGALEVERQKLTAEIAKLRATVGELQKVREDLSGALAKVARLEGEILDTKDRELRRLENRLRLIIENIHTYNSKNRKANAQNKFYKAASFKGLLENAFSEQRKVLDALISLNPSGTEQYQRLARLPDACFAVQPEDQPLDATIMFCLPPERTDSDLRLIFNQVMDASKRSMSQSNRLQLLIDELQGSNPKAMGTLWGPGYASDIQFALTPEYQNPGRKELKQDHTDSMWRKWQQAIVSAERHVDITSLSAPDAGEGGFSDILNEAIMRLAQKNKPITVRILFATIPKLGGINSGSQKIDSTAILNSLISLPGVKESQLEISVGAFDAAIKSSLSLSWNHSKIVAADDHVLFTGGHNLYNSYLWMDTKVRPKIPQQPYSAPVHDVSVLLQGPGVAVTAHKFADQLWSFISKSNEQWGQRLVWSAKADVWKPGWDKVQRCNSTQPDCYLKPFEAREVEPKKAEAHRFISVGRLGNVGNMEFEGTQKQISDEAILHIIRGTKSAVFLSQQRIMPLMIEGAGGLVKYQVTHRFNDLVLDELASLINANRHVFILTSSNLEQVSGKGVFGYQSGTAPVELQRILIARLLSKRLTKDASAAQKKVEEYFHYVPTANGNSEVPNHAKVVISDGDIAYIGSSNVYDDSHQEFGVIIGREKTIELLKTYYRPLWEISSKYWEDEGHKLNNK